MFTEASQFGICAVLAQVKNGLGKVIHYGSKPLNEAQSRYATEKRELIALVNHTRYFKHCLTGRQFKTITDRRVLQWLQKLNDPDALTAANDYELKHRSAKSIGLSDYMSRLPATTAALNMVPTMDVDASVVGQPQPSSQNLPSLNSQTPPVQQSHSTNLPWDTVKSNQTDNEQSGVKNFNETGKNQNNQTDDGTSSLRSETATQPQKTKATRLMMRAWSPIMPQIRCKQTSITNNGGWTARWCAGFSNFESPL